MAQNNNATNDHALWKFSEMDKGVLVGEKGC